MVRFVVVLRAHVEKVLGYLEKFTDLTSQGLPRLRQKLLLNVENVLRADYIGIAMILFIALSQMSQT